MNLLVVGDLHLAQGGQRRASQALTTLVKQHPGATVILAGDALDLAADPAPPRDAIRAIVGAHEALRQALAMHVGRGGHLLVIAGNHDAELGSPEGRETLVHSLGLDPCDAARVRSTPWFARLGAEGHIHIEHGHHYDPDNAMPHPLAPPEASWEPLGVALMREFVTPLGLHALVHANGLPPLQALRRSWELFGKRTPLIFARYMATAVRLLRSSGRAFPASVARIQGTQALASFLEDWPLAGLPLDALIARGAQSTRANTRATFQRLYLDRVLSLGLLTCGGLGSLVGLPTQSLAVAGGAALALSISLGGDRYQGRARSLLRNGGVVLAEMTGARTVIFGHTHEHESHGGYHNTGSFSFPGHAPGRPYLLVDEDGQARHGFAPDVS